MVYKKSIGAFIVVFMLQIFIAFFGFSNVPVTQAGSTVLTRKIVFSLFDTNDLGSVTTQYKLTGLKALFTPGDYLAYVPSTANPSIVAASMEADARVDTASPNYGMALVESGSYFQIDANSFRFNEGSNLNTTTDSGYATARSQWAWSKTNLSAVQ